MDLFDQELFGESDIPTSFEVNRIKELEALVAKQKSHIIKLRQKIQDLTISEPEIETSTKPSISIQTTGIPISTYAVKSDPGTKKLIKIFKDNNWVLIIAYTGNSETRAENCYLHTSKKRTVVNSLMCTECKAWRLRDTDNCIRRVFRYAMTGKMLNAKDFMYKSLVGRFLKAFAAFPDLLRVIIWPTEWLAASDLIGARVELINTTAEKISDPEGTENAIRIAKAEFPSYNNLIRRTIIEKWPKTAAHESNEKIEQDYLKNKAKFLKSLTAMDISPDIETITIGDINGPENFNY